MTLEEMSKVSRELANALFSSDEVRCSQQTNGNPSCIQAEEDRPLTIAERMCDSCRAYWFAEMAAQRLHEMRRWQQRYEAKRKQSGSSP